MGLMDKFSSSPRNSVDEDRPKDLSGDKYRLIVTAGPSYDVSTHRIVPVNTARSTYLENDFIRARVKVRIRGYRGLPVDSPSSSPYFSDPMHEKDQYSIAFSFVPKVDLPSKDLVWGNDFDHPVRDRLPPGVNTAFKIVKDFVDPGLEMDAYAEEPWLLGPALSCWFALKIGDKTGSEGDFGREELAEEKDVLHEGAEGDGEQVRKEARLPENNEKRRKHFLDRANREAFAFEKGRMYSADFYNPYLDFGNFALKLPGFSIKVAKYIDEKSHALRYVFKNRMTGDVYMCVTMNLLWGEELRKAVDGDRKLLESYAGAEFAKERPADVQSSGKVDGIAPNGVHGEPEKSLSASKDAPEQANGVSSKTKAAPAEQAETHAQANGEARSTARGSNGDHSENPSDPTHDERPIEAAEPTVNGETKIDMQHPNVLEKPDDVRQQIQETSISDLLQQTARRDRRDDRGSGFLDDID